VILKRYTFYLINNFNLNIFCNHFSDIQSILSEPDAIRRMGVFNINYDKKKILVNYFLNFISNIYFIFLSLSNIIIFIFIKNKSVRIFFYLFLASVLSPIFFFLVMNKGVDYYHFFNWIVVLGFIYPFISLLYFLEVNFFKSLTLNTIKITHISIIIIILSYSVFNTFLFSKKNLENNFEKRQNITEVTNFIMYNEIFDKKNFEILNLKLRFVNLA
jgi:heme/copper-type cytochrome/quinol oxidase subunit 4